MLHGLTRAAFRRLAQDELPDIDASEFAAYLALRWCDEGEPTGLYPETLEAMFAEFTGGDPEQWEGALFRTGREGELSDVLLEANDILNENTLLSPPPEDVVRISHNFGLGASEGEHLGMALSIIQEGLRPRPEDIGAHSENPYTVFGVAVGYPSNQDARYAPRMPWVLADVPRAFNDFELRNSQPGNVVTLPVIPVEYIVGVNGIPVEMFLEAYNRWGPSQKTAAAYPGNLGFEEMWKFQTVATPEQQELMDNLLDWEEWEQAWDLLKDVTGVELESLKTAQMEELYPRAGAEIDGLIVGGTVPNTSSIGATLTDYSVLGGIREIPLSAFEITDPRDLFYASNDIERTRELAEEIEYNGWIDPLIVVIDEEGPYVLEGAHRLGALSLLGKTSLPALVVLDEEVIDEQRVANA